MKDRGEPESRHGATLGHFLRRASGGHHPEMLVTGSGTASPVTGDLVTVRSSSASQLMLSLKGAKMAIAPRKAEEAMTA